MPNLRWSMAGPPVYQTLMPTLSILAAMVLTATAGQMSYTGPGISAEQDTLPPPPQSPVPDTRPGQTAASTAGQAGQRRTREQVAQDAGIEPMGRISGRIQNRVQSRIRNRIDRYYDPQANATSPFAIAGDQLRTAGRRPR